MVSADVLQVMSFYSRLGPLMHNVAKQKLGEAGMQHIQELQETAKTKRKP